MSRTLLQAVNAGLQCLGEPAVTAFTNNDLLEGVLIDEVNYAVRRIQNRYRFDWTLGYALLQTKDDITTGYVAATNGSTAIASVDSAGAPATSWADLEAGMYIRIGSDDVSYKIASVAAAGPTPPPYHTAVLESAYVGTTTTASTYVALKDEYAIETTDFGDIDAVVFSESDNLSGRPNEIVELSLLAMLRRAGGDFHASGGGKAAYLARIGVDASDFPVYKFWPYFTDEYLIEFWYNRKYSSATDAATVLFLGDAPEIAYDIVEHYVRARAYEWEGNVNEKAAKFARAEAELEALILREHKGKSHQLRPRTYRPPRFGARSESQLAFDRT